MNPFYVDPWLTLYQGNARDVLRGMDSESVHMAVTSPPYWGLRDYGLPDIVWGGGPAHEHTWGPMQRGKRADLLPADQTKTVSPLGGDARGAIPTEALGLGPTNGGRFCACGAWKGQLGLEPTPDLYVEHLVLVFRELRRVLRSDGTFWLNIGDSYSSYRDQKQVAQTVERTNGGKHAYATGRPIEEGTAANRNPAMLRESGLKHKDMVGVPWMLAFALRRDGWWLRSDIIWAKPNVMPESVEDRPTKAHEYLFLFAKSETYFYDADAVLEPLVSTAQDYLRAGKSVRENHAFGEVAGRPLGEQSFATVPSGRRKRTVWFVASQPYEGAHYAPFPPKLVEPTILAGTSERGVCAACGAPWLRMVEKTTTYDNTTTDIGKQAAGPYASQVGGGEDGHDVRHGVYSARETTAWVPDCDCGANPVPAIVLDPFGGSGTTGLVAQKLSRRAVLVDLNAEYLEQQLIRNQQTPLGL